MGIIISGIVYLSYILATILSIAFYTKGKYHSFLFLFFCLLHFNVTSFSNAGIAWTGDFIVMIYVLSCETYRASVFLCKQGTIKLKLTGWQRPILWFTLLLFSGVVISLFRETSLITEFGYAPIQRSLKSFIKFLLYLIPFVLLTNRLHGKIEFEKFIHYLSISSIFPCLAVVYQTFFISSPMYLIHNNNTFTQIFRVESYTGQRGVGFSDESSFFAMILTFSFLATIVAIDIRKKHKAIFISIASLQCLAIVLSLSRTGMIGFLIVSGVYYLQRSFKKTIKFLGVSGIFILIMNFLSQFSGIQFTLAERFSSIFSLEYSASNLERYGIANAFLNMVKSPDAIIGYGFFNYMYYLKSFFPAYLDKSSFTNPDKISSFNLILQLICELGVLEILVFLSCVLIWWKTRPKTAHYRTRIQAFNLAYLSGILACAMSANILAFTIAFLIVCTSSLKFRKCENEDFVHNC